MWKTPTLSYKNNPKPTEGKSVNINCYSDAKSPHKQNLVKSREVSPKMWKTTVATEIHRNQKPVSFGNGTGCALSLATMTHAIFGEYPHRYDHNFRSKGAIDLLLASFTEWQKSGGDAEGFHQTMRAAFSLGRVLWSSLTHNPFSAGVRDRGSDSYTNWKVYPKGTPDGEILPDFCDAYTPPPSAYDCTGRWGTYEVEILRRGSRVLARQYHWCDV